MLKLNRWQQRPGASYLVSSTLAGKAPGKTLGTSFPSFPSLLLCFGPRLCDSVVRTKQYFIITKPHSKTQRSVASGGGANLY